MSDFRQRLLAREPLIGTWVKTPHPVVVEVLGLTGLDCLCLDAEHAPFDRRDIDVSLVAARAAGMPTLVRVPHAAPEHILNALDCGATGVVVPHVISPGMAEIVAGWCRFGAAGRGYAGSTRFAGFTSRAMPENLAASEKETCVIVQIEDLAALEEIDLMASVEAVDCMFIGRIDLTVALGADSPKDDKVITAVEHICAAGKRHGRAIGMFVGDMDEIPHWREAGASLFILQSDQSFLLAGAKALKNRFDQAIR